MTTNSWPTRPIRFVHRGNVVNVSGVAPTLPVLNWLREHAHCTGSKEGCAEGDCGACTAIVAELATPGSAPDTVVGGLSLRPVNTCIRFVPTLDGKALLTVEDLGAGGVLHPAQQAMVDCHGSQCGFCTPGFVMSLAERYEQHRERGTQPGRAALADDLAGNLCRCTGYRPILDAGLAMFALNGPRLNTAPIVAALKTLQQDPPLHYRHEGASLYAPRSGEALAATLLAEPSAQIVAGCTDIGLWVNKQFRELSQLVYLGEVQALRTVVETEGELRIGAGATLEDAWAALQVRWPAVREAWLRFAGPPVRHAGTLGGNVANGSPIGDGPPVLMALGARVQLRRGDRVRSLALDDFYLGYMKNQLEPGEFITALHVPLPTPGQQLRAYKLSKRFDCDISTLFAAFAFTLHEGVLTQVRLAFGGLAAVVKRAAQAEAAMQGQPWTEATLHAAQAALAQDFQPLSDLRGSAAYRQAMASALLRRLWLETRPDDPLPPSQTRAYIVEDV